MTTQTIQCPSIAIRTALRVTKQMNRFVVKLAEYLNADPEGQHRAQFDLNLAERELNEISPDLARQGRKLVMSGVKPPIVEVLSGDQCPSKRIRLSALLTYKIRQDGFAVCAECARIVVLSVEAQTAVLAARSDVTIK